MIPATALMSTHCLHLSVVRLDFAAAKIVINSKQTKLIYFVFPSLPISFSEILRNMALQFGNFIVNHTENDLAIHLEILMNKEIPHITNATPFHFGMSLLKLLGKHTSCLADDFNVLYNAIIAQNIGFEFLFRKVTSISLKALYSFCNML